MKILKFLAVQIMKLSGWNIQGYDVKKLDKYIAIVAPHTSNWDFILGLLVRSSLELDIRFIGKQVLFRRPWGFVFYHLGGYPANRSLTNNLVDVIVDIYNSKQKFALCIAPEGTRNKVRKFKTGFYHIAVQANIPIIMISLDYSRKEILLGDPFHPTQQIERDMSLIYKFYAGAKGKYPSKGIHR